MSPPSRESSADHDVESATPPLLSMNSTTEQELSIELEQADDPSVLKNISNLLSVSEPIQVDDLISQLTKERSLTLPDVHEENETTVTSSNGATAASVKQHAMRTPVSTITQEVINHIGNVLY